jgi:hypothetical protein
MVFNPTFNNISVISWRAVLLVEETRVPGENHRPAIRNGKVSILPLSTLLIFDFGIVPTAW